MSDGFLIKYSDIYKLEQSYKTNLESLMGNIDACSTAIASFISDDTYSGDTASAVKNYLLDVHITLLASMKTIAQNMLDNMALYKAGYYSVDESTNFLLNEYMINQYKQGLASKLDVVLGCEENISTALNKISDIFPCNNIPSTAAINGSHEGMNTEIDTLIENVSNLESQTVSAIQGSVGLLLDYLSASLSDSGTSYTGITNYQAGSFYTNRNVYTLANLSEVFYQQHEDNKDVYDEIWATEKQLADAADERATEGVWKTIGGVALIVGGAACIVLTAGAATPVVAAGAIAGGGTVIFGMADSYEGAQEIYYGKSGDTSSVAVNGIRDDLFKGNEKAYQITESIFAFTASAMVPIGVASKTGTLTFRSGSVAVTKLAISSGAGAGASKITMDATGNRALSMIAGMGASTVTGIGLNVVDRKYYLSHPNELKVSDSHFLNSEGKIDWETFAPNDGIEPGTLTKNQTLKAGTIIDRYGSEYGKYTAPAGASFESRALPYDNNPYMYNKYEVISDIEGVDTSTIASAFGQPGGGVQYQLPQSVKDLVNAGYLKRIPIVENYISPSSVLSTNEGYFAAERFKTALE